MSMTKTEFVERCRGLWFYGGGGTASFMEQLAVVAEEAGAEWGPEPTPEPTGDLGMVRVVDAAGSTWRPSRIGGWLCIEDGEHRPWAEIPQPATVLVPKGGQQ